MVSRQVYKRIESIHDYTTPMNRQPVYTSMARHFAVPILYCALKQSYNQKYDVICTAQCTTHYCYGNYIIIRKLYIIHTFVPHPPSPLLLNERGRLPAGRQRG
jgi:hypothetical protein